MLCREVRGLMSLYLDGQLEPDQTRQIEQHFVGCDACRGRLELMQQIPVALQTDRMLAPQPQFTTLVMQRIIVQQQVGNTRLETRYSRVSVEYTTQTQPSDEEDEEPEPTPAKIISLAERRAGRPRNTAELALRMSALAAALVLMVGAGIYIAAQGPTGTGEASTASVYGAIKDFGDSLRNAFGSPVELVAGLAIAGVILIGLWYLVKTLRTHDGPSRQEQTRLKN